MKRVLLIEDDPFLIDIYGSKFKEEDFEVQIISDGAAGLESIKEKNPDIILLDLVLPHNQGWEILKIIREDESLKAVPVVIFSNLSQKADIEKGIALGATRYLVKAQYTPTEVVAEVNKILNKK
jgi:DNA-binding response OmpR family regulator